MIPKDVIKRAGQIKAETYLEAFHRTDTRHAEVEAQTAAYEYIAAWAAEQAISERWDS